MTLTARPDVSEEQVLRFHLDGASAQRVVERAFHHEQPAPQHLAHRHRMGRRNGLVPGGGGKLGENGRGVIVIDASDHLAVLRRLPEKPRLDGGIIVHAAMAVDMIGRQVGQDADIRRQARRQVDLEAGHFQHIDGLGRRRRQLQHRLADIAADLGVEAALGEDVSHQRGGGGLAVGAGDGDHRRLGGAVGIGANFMGEQFDIADDANLGAIGMFHHAMRLGMGQRHAGR